MKTIAAISTAPGIGGIGIVRISGKDTFDVIKKIFKPKNEYDIENIKGYTIKYGYYKDNNVTVIKINEDGTLTRGGAEYTYTVENDQIINSLKGFTYRVTSDTTLVEVLNGKDQTTLNYYQD